MKEYRVEYSLTFYNTEHILADSPEEAEKKFWALEEAQGELDALGGDEDGYKIESIEEIGEDGESVDDAAAEHIAKTALGLEGTGE